MIINPQVPLHRLVLSMSDAMDCVHKEISNHQLRVAYMSTNMARSMGLSGQDLLHVFIAAAFHDIGLLRSDNRMLAVHYRELEELGWHGEVGYQLLRRQPLLAGAAELVRDHHTAWNHGAGCGQDGRPVPIGSRLILLADEVDRQIDRTVPILKQRHAIMEHIHGLSGPVLDPQCVDAFSSLADAEAFWFDCVSERIYGILLKQVDWPTLTLDETVVMSIARMFAQVVDAGSPWTATHSAGVTATAVALAQRLDFSPREQALMRAAGYLHDLGKLTIPSAILDKPSRLDPDEATIMRRHTYHTFRILDTIGGMPQIAEWAAFHHERIDGTGYPFRHRGHDLTLGSRIMAVADVFTAITEDRPYRKGMSKQDSLDVLHKLVTGGALDGDVVDVLGQGFEEIAAIRSAEQTQYAAEQKRLAEHMSAVTMAGAPA